MARRSFSAAAIATTAAFVAGCAEVPKPKVPAGGSGADGNSEGNEP